MLQHVRDGIDMRMRHLFTSHSAFDQFLMICLQHVGTSCYVSSEPYICLVQWGRPEAIKVRRKPCIPTTLSVVCFADLLECGKPCAWHVVEAYPRGGQSLYVFHWPAKDDERVCCTRRLDRAQSAVQMTSRMEDDLCTAERAPADDRPQPQLDRQLSI